MISPRLENRNSVSRLQRATPHSYVLKALFSVVKIKRKKKTFSVYPAI